MPDNLDPCEETPELLEASPLPEDDEENAAELPQTPDSVANLDLEEGDE